MEDDLHHLAYKQLTFYIIADTMLTKTCLRTIEPIVVIITFCKACV